MTDIRALSQVAPLLLPETASLDVLSGYIQLRNDQYFIRIMLPPLFADDVNSSHITKLKRQKRDVDQVECVSMALDQSQVYLCKKLWIILCGGTYSVDEVCVSNIRKRIMSRLRGISDVSSFILELSDIACRAIDALDSSSVSLNSSYTSKQSLQLSEDFYNNLIGELEVVGWEHVVSISPCLTHIELSIDDNFSRNHIFSIALPCTLPDPCNYKSSSTQDIRVSACLPIPFVFKIPAQASPICKGWWLLSIKNEFTTLCESLSKFWDEMEDLDKHCLVLEPSRPSRADVVRRLAVARHVSIQLKVDPLNPLLPPDIKFLGAESVVGELRDTFFNNIGQWSSENKPGIGCIRRNICSILNITLPGPRTDKISNGDYSVECGICYAYKISNNVNSGMVNKQNDDGIPDRICDDTRCGKAFHRRCLVEWLRSVSTTTQAFDSLFGRCPYCSTPISVRKVAY